METHRFGLTKLWGKHSETESRDALKRKHAQTHTHTHKQMQTHATPSKQLKLNEANARAHASEHLALIGRMQTYTFVKTLIIPA